MLPASDAPCAYLLLTNVSAEEWCVAIESAPKTIGRSRAADVLVPQRFSSVSRRHVAVWASPQGSRIRDLGSRHGTRVNGVWIKPDREVAIAVGDRIWLGGGNLEVVAEIPVSVAVLMESGATPVAEDPNDTAIRRHTMPLPAQVLLAELSQAELEIVLWMGRGLITDEDLGRKLHRSPHTVRTQVNSVFQKLDVHSRAEIIAFLKRRT